KGELAECGATPGPRRTKLCVDYWETICSINNSRTRVETLSDLFVKAVADANQGKLFNEEEDIDALIGAAEAEEELPLVKSAREDREGKSKAAPAAEPIVNPLGVELKVGNRYRFTSRTSPDQWAEGIVLAIGGKGAITIDRTANAKGAARGECQMNAAVLTWTLLEPAPAPAAEGKAPAKASAAESKASDGTGRFTFPGTFVLTPSRHGAPPQRFKVTSGNVLLAVVSEACGVTPGSDAECTIHEIKGEVYIGGGRVAKLHQVADDAEAFDTVKPEPAAVETAQPKTSSKPLVDVKDKHGRKKKAASA
ncbi:MAG TPA: hypothetical protein PLW65_26170, partial [Pseudomonadota bacterium]|nr:hypothetical protein [Pseudomonadota bacterium]